MKTTAAILTEINKPLQIEELTIPPLKKGQVLVEVAHSGICHSQLNEIQGLKGEDKFLPHTLGHEGSGIVLEIGPDVTKVKPGDHVVLTWIKGSGHDVPSAQYLKKDGTVVNSGAISTFLTHAVVSENRLVPITKEMPLKEAALLGCAIPTGAGIVLNSARVQPGSSVAVFGCGGIGISAIMASSAIAKAKIIIAVDVVDQKLDYAKHLGATHIINASNEDAIEAIMELTERQSVDVAIECAGKKVSMEAAFMCVKDNGGLCVIAGNLPKGQKIEIDPFDLIKGKRIVGTWGGETRPDRDVASYVKLYLKGELKLNRFNLSHYQIGSINKAFLDLHQASVGRAMISFL